MQFDGNIRIKAEPGRVWDLLMDVDRFSSCVPGVEGIRTVDERTFDGTIIAAVGPISGKFDFCARIVDTTPPSAMVSALEGTDSVTKSTVTAHTILTVTELDAGETDLGYASTVDIKGRLAILGDMVIRATATLVLEEFGKRVRLALEGETE